MMQTQRHSLIESITNTVVGFLVALTSQMLIYPFFGIHIHFETNLKLTAVFTVISILRGYALRRWFTRRKVVA